MHSALPNAYKPFWVEGGGHNNLEIMAREPFFERLKEFTDSKKSGENFQNNTGSLNTNVFVNFHDIKE